MQRTKALTANYDNYLSHVFDFIDNLDELPRHTVMFYEEPKFARMVAIRFLKNGLRRGDRCMYDLREGDGKSNNNSILEQEMDAGGIDRAFYMDSGLLYANLFADGDVADLNSFRNYMEHFYRDLLKEFGSESNFPTLRWIGRAPTNINTDDGMAVQLQIEKFYQDDPFLRRMSGKVTGICSYRLNNIQESLDNEDKWVTELLLSHDAVIYLPRNGSGVALRLR